MEVTIDVFATNLTRGERRHTNTARVTMVALDDAGKPVPVPRLVCETREEKVRFLEGFVRRRLRKERAAQFSGLQARLAGASDAEIEGWFAQPSSLNA